MPKKKYQNQQPLDNNLIDQLEIAAADSGFMLFCEDKKLTEPTYIQICVLKNFFEIYKESVGYACMDNIDIETLNGNLSSKCLKKIFNLSYQTDPKAQALVKIDRQDLIPVIVLIKLQSLISNLDNEKSYDSTCKNIFSLFDRMLPYHPINIRDVFYLDSLFAAIEKMRVIFFKNLNSILAKTPKSLLFEQIQISCICSMLFWVNHSKSKNFYLIVDALLILSKYNLESFMFKAYTLTDNNIISILPSPLRIIDSISKYHDIETTNIKLIKKLQVLNNIKHSFLELQKQNSLQMSLRQEFIFFIDNVLDSSLTTNTNNRTFILKHCDNLRPLVKKIFLSYNSLSMSVQELSSSNAILEMMDKWQTCIQINLQAFEKSAQTRLELAEQEELEINLHNKELLAQQAQPSKKTIQAAQQFAERQLKQAEEEDLEIKKNQAEKFGQPSFIDQYQHMLTKTFLTIPNIKYLKQENIFSIKEQIITKEIVKYMRLTPIEKLLDKTLLKELEERLFFFKSEIREDELYSLLLLYINLLDIFLSRINYKMQIYKKQYAPHIEKMFHRHGQKDFSGADHALNRQISQDAKLILDNLTVTNDYCECILKIFDIINILKPEITEIEFYKIWNLPINFRKSEFKDNYDNVFANLTQLRIYRENKRKAFKDLDITVNKKKVICEISEKEINKKLEKLIDSIYKIDSQINKSDSLSPQFPKVFLAKQSQVRQQKIQNTVINKEKKRIPISYNRNEVRRSQSVAYLNSIYVTEIKDLKFFTSESQNNTEREKNHLSIDMSHRRMSI